MSVAENGESARILNGWAVLGLWALTFALAWGGLGLWMVQLVEGITPGQLPAWGWMGTLAALFVSLVASVIWARSIGRAAPGEPAVKGMGRRRFLIGSATAVGGLLGTGLAALGRASGWITVTGPALIAQTPTVSEKRDEWRGARVREYRRLGRTGFRVSDIALGSSGIKDEAVARAAIERGVNYFDTSPDYSATGSERILGRAMKGHRDKMFVATKFCRPDGHLTAGSSVREYMEVVEGSLERLQTDYVDLVHVHSCATIDRITDPNLHEAFGRLKEQGKARFLGVSSHSPNVEQVMRTALDDGRFDVMMIAYHHGAWPTLPALVDEAKQKDVGFVAMKTLKGAHHALAGYESDRDSYPQSAFKWVLSNPSVSCLVISFTDPRHVDEYLYASGGRLTSDDVAVLARYDQVIAGRHCFAHCGACLGSCPESLAINDVLRHRMYFEDYGQEKLAMQLYAGLEKQADVCIGCSAPCTGACPFEVPIQERTTGAHQLLTLG